MKSLIKAYALPLIVLVVGGGVYYLVFSKSVDFHVDSAKIAQNTPKAPQPTPATPKQPQPAPSTQNLTPPAPPALATPAPAAPPALPASPAGEPIQKPIQDFAHNPKSPPQEPQLAEQTGEIYYAKVANLNIRALPKSFGQILGKLAMGQGVSVIEIHDGWARLDSGGWVSLALLTPTQPSHRPYIVLAKTLNIRALPDSSAPVIGALYKDQHIQVAEIHDGWAKLDSGGWVSLRLIKAL